MADAENQNDLPDDVRRWVEYHGSAGASALAVLKQIEADVMAVERLAPLTKAEITIGYINKPDMSENWLIFLSFKDARKGTYIKWANLVAAANSTKIYNELDQCEFPSVEVATQYMIQCLTHHMW